MERSLLLKAIDINRNPPVNLTPNDLPLFENEIKKTIDPVYLLSLKNYNVSPESVVWKKFSILNDLLIYPGHTKMYNWKYTLSNRVKRKKEVLNNNQYILFTDYWADVYFHWVCDSLPRLFLLKDYLKDSILLLPDHYKHQFYMETLEAFSVKGIKRMEVDKYYHVKKLLTCTQPTISGEINPSVTKDLRAFMLKYFSTFFTGKHKYENVYVSRAKAKYRKVLNEQEVVALLEKYKFRVIYFEDYTLKEQVEIAYNARNIISIHGANLTNIFYMQPGGNVLEFRKEMDDKNNYYYSLADSVGLNYFYQNCEYVDRRVGNFFDLTVDIKEMERLVKAMVKV